MARTAGSPPEFMSSPILAAFLAVELRAHADAVAQHAADNGSSAIDAVRVRALRGAALQLDTHHGEGLSS